MPACRECRGRGWVSILLRDLKGYSVPSIPFPCKCKAGEKWARQQVEHAKTGEQS